MAFSDSVTEADATELDAEFITAIAGITAVAAVFASAAPTGTAWWDVVLRAGAGAIFVFSGARGTKGPLIAAAGVATMLVGATVWLIVGFAGFVAALAGQVQPDPAGRTRSISAGLTFLALLHLGPVGFFGLPSLIAGVLMAVVLAQAFRLSSEPTRARIRMLVVATGLVAGAALVVAAYVAIPIRSSADAGVAAARRGLDAARSGDTEALTAQLEQAQLQLDSANDGLGSIWLKPLRLVPIAAQNHRSVSLAAQQGSIVANEAVTIALDADIDQLQLRQGQFDLDLLSSMAPLLDNAALSLQNAATSLANDRSPWLVPPVDNQLQSFANEVVEVLPEIQLSAHAARVMPGMLGADAERRYLMLFGSPAESREFGGFVGGYALISVQQGSLDLVEAGSVNDLVMRANEGELDHPDGYPTEYLAVDPAEFPQNFTSSPNLDLVARAVRDVFPTLEGAPIDGVIYADPFALAAMTELTGPVFIPGVADPLNATTLPQFIFGEQYRLFPNRSERFSAIGSLATATAAAFERADLPGPERLGEVLGPLARAGRLQVVTYDDDENAFLASVRLQRNFVAPTALDSFAVIQTNATASKLDIYLHREIDYRVQVDDTGELSGQVDVLLRSEIADDVPAATFGETTGTNEVLLSLYSQHRVTSVTVDGVDHQFVSQTEFDFFRHALFLVPLAPNTEALVRFELQGEAPPGPYQVAVWHQPLVNNDVVTISYTSPNGESYESTREIVENWLYSAEEPG